MAKISESHLIAYILETNIAVSILDGEFIETTKILLWTT